MNAPADPLTDMLTDLAALGMRGARVITRLMEIEQDAAEAIAEWLPAKGKHPASKAHEIGLSVDAVDAALAQAVPRAEKLALAFDRVSRSVRFCVALIRRMQAGWPRAASDNRQAMVRRQVARKVGEAIRRETEHEAAERLFDELAERLEDPAISEDILVLPVEEIVRRLCRDLGLAMGALRTLGSSPPETGGAARPIDSG